MQDTPTRTHTHRERDGQRETQRYSVMSSRTTPLLQSESVPVITQTSNDSGRRARKQLPVFHTRQHKHTITTQ